MNWLEAKVVAIITWKKIVKFIWRCIVCRYGRQEHIRKLRPNWEGPYKVIEARQNGPYILGKNSRRLAPKNLKHA